MGLQVRLPLPSSSDLHSPDRQPGLPTPPLFIRDLYLFDRVPIYLTFLDLFRLLTLSAEPPPLPFASIATSSPALGGAWRGVRWKGWLSGQSGRHEARGEGGMVAWRDMVDMVA